MVDLAEPLSDVRLLIVEDEAFIAIMVEDFAEELGCRSFHTVATVPAGLAAIETFKPQLALVDSSLSHGQPDFTIADALADAGIPFIFTTGHRNEIIPLRHRDRDFLAKPFSIEMLREAIVRIRRGESLLDD